MPATAIVLLALAIGCLLLLAGSGSADEEPICISGIYPHLAVTNHQNECGIGAVVPWAGKLWYLTYSPHEPDGSDDRLYELSEDLQPYVRPESIGGTPANRMIHRESSQLSIGPYYIDAEGRVRAISYEVMHGRPTATLRHLTDPANKVYIFGMEGHFYEVDVHTLEVHRLYGDHPAVGSHGKGGYTGQGRVVLANNGEWGWHGHWLKDHSYDAPTGALLEWDGDEFSVVDRRQFCEVTGPDGIYGSSDAESPIWATGWDRRSVLLKLLDGGKWYTFRLPKASHTYDGGHGWHTEWPRIREVAPDLLLMTMHGMFYDFPKHFSAGATGGLRPICSYLKMVVDFCTWNDHLVFACNDASRMGNPFVNQPSSNLWFGRPEDLRTFGAPAGWGGVWVNDAVKAGEPSDPFLFAGFPKRVVHLANGGDDPVSFALGLDVDGAGRWEGYRSIEVPAQGYAYHVFPDSVRGEWVRVRTDADCKSASAFFHYLPITHHGLDDRELFRSLAPVDGPAARTTGIIRPRGGDLGTLHFLADRVGADGSCERLDYYEIGPEMQLRRTDDDQAARWLADNAALGEPDFQVDEASAIVTDEDGARWRLPKSHPAYDEAWPEGWPRGIREVVTERALLNCHGTFYELPRDSSGGMAGMRPICTHNRAIADFCSWRGMLVVAGNLADAEPDGHYFASDDGQVGLWFGNVDDLWRLGKPRGHGGPWKDTAVTAGEPSDPYLMTGFDRKTLELSHDLDEPVEFAVEVDFAATGDWHVYDRIVVPSGEKAVHHFPDGYAAHWVRVRANRNCTATAWFIYE